MAVAACATTTTPTPAAGPQKQAVAEPELNPTRADEARPVPLVQSRGFATDLSGSIETAFSQDWDNWALRLGEDSGSMRTRFHESWDRWRISYGPMSVDVDTRFSNSWDKWRIQGGGVRIDADTRFSKSWDKWKLDTADGHLQVSASSTSPHHWLIEGAGGRITVQLVSAGGSAWRVHDQMPNAAASTKLAAMFLVVQNGSLRGKVALPD